MFRAILIQRNGDGQQLSLTDVEDDALPDGDVLVAVDWSTINYKDALAVTGKAPIVQAWPMVPGIDLAGTVLESAHPAWRPGDAVLLNGAGAGETRWGGLAERARVDGDALIAVPPGLSAFLAMAIGTAGYTAALCVDRLLARGITAGQGPVLVTGATGGVGSFAVMLLARAGFAVTAATGKMDEADYLRSLGAREVVDRASLSKAGKPLQAMRWAGVIDSVGSSILANACAQTRGNGVVVACGLAQGADFPVTVLPFILRGVELHGINCSAVSAEDRDAAWRRLAADVDAEAVAAMTRTIGLAEVAGLSGEMLAGRVRGRIVVDVKR